MRRKKEDGRRKRDFGLRIADRKGPACAQAPAWQAPDRIPNSDGTIYFLPSGGQPNILRHSNLNYNPMKKSVLSLITALIGVAFVVSCTQKQETATSTTAATTKASPSPSPHKKRATAKKKAPATEASPSESASPSPTP